MGRGLTQSQPFTATVQFADSFDATEQSGQSAVASAVFDAAAAAPVPKPQGPSAKDRVLLRRRGLIGASNGETLNDPAILVVRKIDQRRPDLGFVSRTLGDLKVRGVVLASEGSDIIFATDKFLLQNLNEPDEERLGPFYSFGQPKVYGIGRNPRIYTYSGTLVEQERDLSGRAMWMDVYDRYLRGSKCIQEKAFVDLYFRDQIRRGYLLHTNMADSSSEPFKAPFAFTMFIIDEISTSVQVLDLDVPEGVDNG